MMRLPIPLLAALCLLTACQTRLPPLATPVLKTSAPLSTDVATDAATNRAWPNAKWWEGYGDSTLNALVERALTVSPTLTAAAARQARAVSTLQLQAADSGIRIDAQGQVQRQRISDNGLLPPKLLGISWYSISELGLNIDYHPDFWHRQIEALRAAGARAQAAEAERAELGATVAVSVAKIYFTVRTELEAQDLTEQNVTLIERQRQIALARKTAQLGGSDEVRRLDLQLLAARNLLGDQQASVALQRAALAEFLDQSPEQLPAIATAAVASLPQHLPDDASLSLIARRGDLRAARWRVEAGHASAALARKAWLPDISLRALLGVSSRDVGTLLSAGSAAPAFTAAASLPIFDAGARRARFSSAQADMEVAIAEYHTTLLMAAREVNQSLVLRATATSKIGNGRLQVADAEGLRDSAALQLRLGLIDARPLLAAELQLLDRRTALIRTEHQLIDADLALIRALGGGYEDPHRE